MRLPMWAATAPVVHERIAEYVLADALDYQPLGLGRRTSSGVRTLVVDISQNFKHRRARAAHSD